MLRLGVTPEVIADELGRLWTEPPGSIAVAGQTLAVQTPQGAWELLVFATLAGARVRATVVEHCFGQLRAWGLLEWSEFRQRSAAHEAAFDDVLDETYRAPVRRRIKREAIYRNAQRLQSAHAGDLHLLYRRCGEPGALVAELQRFEQVRFKALWFIRVMALYGGWQVAPPDTAYYGLAVRSVLARLDFDGRGEVDPWVRSADECREQVEALFAGRTEALFLHGSELCLKNDRRVCDARCPFRANCLVWNRWRQARRLDT